MPGGSLPRQEERAESVRFCARVQVLPYSQVAIARFEELRGLRLNVGGMDLRIAAIVLEAGATLVTRNLRDFRRVGTAKAIPKRRPRRCAQAVQRTSPLRLPIDSISMSALPSNSTRLQVNLRCRSWASTPGGIFRLRSGIRFRIARSASRICRSRASPSPSGDTGPAPAPAASARTGACAGY